MEADAERIMALAEQIREMVYPPIFQAMIKTRCAD
jgi:hypothetical protein